MVRRRFNRDTIRTPGQDAPSADDRYKHFLDEDYFFDDSPDRKTGFFNEGPALNAARMALEFNRRLTPSELADAAGGSGRPENYREDTKLAREAGLLPEGFNLDTSEDEMRMLRDMLESLRYQKANKRLDPLQGNRRDGYYMPDKFLGLVGADDKRSRSNKPSTYDNMRAIINARLMDARSGDLMSLTDRGRSRPPKRMEDFYDNVKYDFDGFGGYLPRAQGARVRDTDRLRALAKPEGAGEDTPLFGDVFNEERSSDPRTRAAFRRLLSSEAADLLNTMQERRHLDRIDREFGPMEDMGDVSVGTEAFPEDFQILQRSEGEIFRDAWDVLKEEAPIDSMDWDLHLYHPEYGNIRSSKEIQQLRDFKLADGTVLPVAYEVFHGIDGRIEYFSPEAMGAAKTPYDLSEGDLTELVRYGCYGCDKEMDMFDHGDNEGMCDECHLKYPDGAP